DTASFNAANGAITLNKANTLAGIVALNATNGAVTLNNAQALQLGNVTVTNGTLAVTTTSGAITQASGTTINVANASDTASFTTATGNITLNGANTFSGPVAASATTAG